MFTRNRHFAARLYERSHEPSRFSVSGACWFSAIKSLAMPAVCSGMRCGSPDTLMGTSWPSSSTCGGRPGEKSKSLTRESQFTIAVTSAAVLILTFLLDETELPLPFPGTGVEPEGERSCVVSKKSPQCSTRTQHIRSTRDAAQFEVAKVTCRLRQLTNYEWCE